MKRLRFQIKFLPSPLWKRVVAYFIDILIINFIIAAPFQKLLAEAIPKEASFVQTYKLLLTQQINLGNVVVTALGLAIITILYWTLLEFKVGQSVGKIFLNIFVHSTTEKKNVSLTFRQAFIRNVSKISTILLALDVLYMFYAKTHQRWLEKISNTQVVQKFGGVTL